MLEVSLPPFFSVSRWLRGDLAELWHDSIRARMAARESAFNASKRSQTSQNQRTPNVRLVPMRPQSSQGGSRGDSKHATFGQRRSIADVKGKQKAGSTDRAIRQTGDGGMEISFIPSAISNGTLEDGDDGIISGSQGGKRGEGKEKRRRGVEEFGAGMEKGGEKHDAVAVLDESERSGRTHRRKGMRSGSKNTFRRM